MRRTPEGLLVFGDAICSFNPIYGQGMTVAAVEAIVLPDCLRRGERDLPQRFSNAYFERVMSAAEADLVVAQQFMRVIA